MLWIHQLRWSDLESAPPQLPGELLQRLTDVVSGHAYGTAHSLKMRRDDVGTALHRHLVDTHGLWVAGWSWSMQAGGPVHGYCCPSHSLLVEGDDDPSQTAQRVAEGVESWHRLILLLRETFAELRARTRGRPMAEEFETVGAALLPLVLERTQSEDAWYATFTQLMLWYTEFAEYDRAAIEEELDEIVSGRFQSWIAPEPDVARKTLRAAAEYMSRAQGETVEPFDGLAAWHRIRESSFRGWGPRAKKLPAADGHRRFIVTHDQPRGDDRAQRMNAALDYCRDAASDGRPLSFDGLRESQAIVLGCPIDQIRFRSGIAWAKAGREFYSIDESTPQSFERALAAANDETEHTSIRAARAYLDILFYHPFQDGNARAARLALDWILTRDSQCIAAPGPVFLLRRSARDSRVGMMLAMLLEQASGPRGDES